MGEDTCKTPLSICDLYQNPDCNQVTMIDGYLLVFIISPASCHSPPVNKYFYI